LKTKKPDAIIKRRKGVIMAGLNQYPLVDGKRVLPAEVYDRMKPNFSAQEMERMFMRDAPKGRWADGGGAQTATEAPIARAAVQAPAQPAPAQTTPAPEPLPAQAAQPAAQATTPARAPDEPLQIRPAATEAGIANSTAAQQNVRPGPASPGTQPPNEPIKPGDIMADIDATGDMGLPHPPYPQTPIGNAPEPPPAPQNFGMDMNEAEMEAVPEINIPESEIETLQEDEAESAPREQAVEAENSDMEAGIPDFSLPGEGMDFSDMTVELAAVEAAHHEESTATDEAEAMPVAFEPPETEPAPTIEEPTEAEKTEPEESLDFEAPEATPAAPAPAEEEEALEAEEETVEEESTLPEPSAEEAEKTPASLENIGRAVREAMAKSTNNETAETATANTVAATGNENPSTRTETSTSTPIIPATRESAATGDKFEEPTRILKRMTMELEAEAAVEKTAGRE
jgi:nicotinate-nucleotide--dimethylbenzimidazole phosphoribosyltransferase